MIHLQNWIYGLAVILFTLIIVIEIMARMVISAWYGVLEYKQKREAKANEGLHTL